MPHKPLAPKLEVDLQALTTTVRVTCEGLSAAPRPDDDHESLQDYGDEVASWLEQHAGIPRARLVGIGSGSEYCRVLLEAEHECRFSGSTAGNW